MFPGGKSPVKPADESVQAIINAVRGSLEDKAHRIFAEYIAVSVSTQVVSGTNYFVKILVGNEQYVHAKIYQPLPGRGDPELISFQLNKTKEDEL